MMPDGGDDSSYVPPMLIPHRPHDASSGSNRLGERPIRILHDHYHPNRPAGKCLRTEILVLGRLICHPKLGSIGERRATTVPWTRYTTLAPKADL
jgi:hypothetical protein